MEGSACSDHLPPPDEEIIRKNLVFPHSVAPPPFEASSPFPACVIFVGAYDHQERSNERNHPHNHPPDQKEGGARSPDAARHGDDSRHQNEAAGGGGGGERDPSAATGPGRWMSSKMRFMRKMMELERTVSARRQDAIRVCSDCNTTKTPLWRSGPRGPKSLCNACGIRQRKARRAMAALAAVAPAATVRKERMKLAAGSGGSAVPFKKRLKFAAAGHPRARKLDLDELATVGLGGGGPAAVRRRMLPRDEKEEAALLLMALSCGLIYA